MSKHNQHTRMIWWVTGTAVAVVAGLVAMSQFGGTKAVTPVAIQTDAEVHAVKNVMGNPSARVQLVEYGDYL